MAWNDGLIFALLSDGLQLLKAAAEVPRSPVRTDACEMAPSETAVTARGSTDRQEEPPRNKQTLITTHRSDDVISGQQQRHL